MPAAQQLSIRSRISIATGRSFGAPISPFEFGLFIAILLGLGAVAGLLASARLAVSVFAFDECPYYLYFAVALLLHYGLRRSVSHVGRATSNAARWYAQFALVAIMGAIASYPLASDSHGFSDSTLQRIDHELHFDWIIWYKVVAAHPVLQCTGRAAYESIYVTPAVLLGYFAWEDRRTEAQRFLASFLLAAVLTLALFPLMPAVGPLASMWHGPIPYMPASALWQPTLIPELRTHVVHRVDVGTLKGLVSAPSFHTEAAVLYIAASWPCRKLRVPVILINLAMLTATIVEGTHYLADILIGALCATASLLSIWGLETGSGRWMVRIKAGVEK